MSESKCSKGNYFFIETSLQEITYIASILKYSTWGKYLELKGMKEVESVTLECTK